VLISVSDTGIGMTAEETAMLFNEFVRIKNEKTRGILGSGLGLSIIRKLAAFYGGDCSVQSTPGQGSTFTVSLDLSSEREPTDNGTQGHNPLAAGRQA
jgi:signal transduction histidine kinase